MKIYLNHRPGSILTDVFILTGVPRTPNDVEHSVSIKKDGQVILTKIDYDKMGATDAFPPTMTLDDRMLREVIQAFVDLGKERGIKGEEESFAKGRLSAIEPHLADMRRMVFEEPEVTGTPTDPHVIKSHD